MATSLSRLVRKEVSLGAIRELQPPKGHIGLQYAPFMDVPTDDVIFDYIKGGLQDGLAPARAEDAEAELGQKDTLLYGSGRASVIDWAFKDKYTASDVTRYRDDLATQQALEGANVTLNYNYTGRQIEQFQRTIARDDAARRKRLDNRIEWLIMQALETGKIIYNDGKIKFTVDYGRPAGQQNQAPAAGLWGTAASDPINDLLGVQQTMFDTYGVKPTRGIISTRIFNAIWKSDKFLAALGLPVVGGSPSKPLDPNYMLVGGYTPQAALSVVEAATGISFQVYDSVYRTRPVGSTTWTNNRFTTDDKVILLPSEGDLGEIDDTELGFGKTLTSPHPEGNFTSGFYEWEDESKDPWLHVRGSGIKAFPVFPYLEYSYVLDVL